MSDTTDTTTTTTGEGQSSSSTTTASTAEQTKTGQTAAAQTGTTEQSQGSAQTTDAGQGGEGDKPWQDSLPGELATDPLFRSYKTVDELAKAHKHLTSLKGATAAELLKIPAKPRSEDPEAWTAFDAARGVPADAKDYKIELAAEAAADTPELANILRELGGKAKFDNDQMAAVVETLNGLGKLAAEQEAEAVKAETQATTDTLKKEWGAAYDGNHRAIGKLIRDAVGGELDEQAQADLSTQLASNLTLSRVLAHAVAKMAEPGAPEGGGRGDGQGGDRPLTPAGATASLNAFYADAEKMKALNNSGHPQHKAALEERRKLLAMQSAGKRPDQASA